ncbi:MAG TPA: YHYH protein [Ignavibacteria bacterium]|nr:YHYH protein [Ignavibacteria bacterium]
MKIINLIFLLFITSLSFAQLPPVVTFWQQNPNNITGYNGIPADVQQVFYSDNFVYVKCTGIPSYTIGPWPMNPNQATNQNWTFKITRFPTPNANPTVAGNGQLGVLKNGVVIFNAGDAMSYNNQNIWYRVAYYFEGTSFDSSGGHPAPGGSYHYHINMTKLYTPNPNLHSPLLGYMFDGYPVYGAYGYANTNGTGGIRRIKSGYRKRNITTRTTLPNGTVLQPSQYGPAINIQYPLGCFIQDYELIPGGSDLDRHNGRFSVTPEYPNGIYAYYMTLDSLGIPEYPYIIGPTYYGNVVAGNSGPGSGHIVISEPVTQFLATGIENTNSQINFVLHQNFPNPFNPSTKIKFEINKSSDVKLFVYDISGKLISTLINQNLNSGVYESTFDGNNLSSGVYFYKLINGTEEITKRMLLVK